MIFRGGSMFSLNRFVFAVPFIIVAIDYFLKSAFTIDTKKLLLSLLLVVLFFLMFGSYVHLQNFLKFLFLACYLTLPLALKHETKPFSVVALLLLIGLNVFFQLFFYIRFSHRRMDWIGVFRKSENKPTFRQAQAQTPATQHCFQANTQSFRRFFPYAITQIKGLFKK